METKEIDIKTGNPEPSLNTVVVEEGVETIPKGSRVASNISVLEAPSSLENRDEEIVQTTLKEVESFDRQLSNQFFGDTLGNGFPAKVTWHKATGRIQRTLQDRSKGLEGNFEPSWLFSYEMPNSQKVQRLDVESVEINNTSNSPQLSVTGDEDIVRHPLKRGTAMILDIIATKTVSQLPVISALLPSLVLNKLAMVQALDCLNRSSIKLLNSVDTLIKRTIPSWYKRFSTSVTTKFSEVIQKATAVAEDIQQRYSLNSVVIQRDKLKGLSAYAE